MSTAGRAIPRAALNEEQPEELLFGTAQGLHSLGLRGLHVHALYGQAGAEFYDSIVGLSGAEAGDFLRAAQQVQGPILDLACGSGRLTVPLAQRGFEVVGIDLSEPMLARLNRRLAELPAQVAGRVRVVHADMLELDLDRRFPLAILAATSVVLVPLGRLPGFLAGVRRHLEPGGTLALDYTVHDLERLAAIPVTRTVLPLSLDRERTGFAICEQRFDLIRREETVNFFVEVLAGDTTSRSIFVTRKQVFTRDELLADLEQAGFELVTSRLRDAGPGLRVEFLLCRARAGS